MKRLAKFTISKVFSIVMFITMMIFFFIWLVSQISDLGTVFGFRTSHTVANDVANIMTSLGASSGEVIHKYSIEPSKSTTSPFNYEMVFGSNIVCVTSFRGDKTGSTTDCVTHPYCFDDVKKFESKDGIMELTFKKEIAEGAYYSCMTVWKGNENSIDRVSGCSEQCQR